MKRIFSFLFLWHKVWFPFVFHVFSPRFDHYSQFSVLAIPTRASKQRFVPTLSCSSFADMCTRWQASARVSTHAYACIDEEQKCKRKRWWLFAPRIRTRVDLTIECLPFFYLFCFVVFPRLIVVSSCRRCECYRRHVLIFTAMLDRKSFSEWLKYIFKVYIFLLKNIYVYIHSISMSTKLIWKIRILFHSFNSQVQKSRIYLKLLFLADTT